MNVFAAVCGRLRAFVTPALARVNAMLCLWWRRTHLGRFPVGTAHSWHRQPACPRVGNGSPATSCAEDATMLIVPALVRVVFGVSFAALGVGRPLRQAKSGQGGWNVES